MSPWLLLQQIVASEIKHKKSCKSVINGKIIKMFQLDSHVDEADERIVLHVANSLKYNIQPI